MFCFISSYTSETLTTSVSELNMRLKTITSQIEQAADVQLQRQFHGFIEVFCKSCRNINLIGFPFAQLSVTATDHAYRVRHTGHNVF